MSDPILRLTPYAESCVFSKQSPVPGFCDHIRLQLFIFTPVAPLLPRLRGQLAEFLNDSSPAHLSLLSQSTCVGFGYGRHGVSLEAFPGSRASMPSRSSLYAPHQVSPLDWGVCLPAQASPLDRLPSAGAPSFLRHSIVKRLHSGTGLATCCPSATPFGLTLGPALPWADQPSPGTLGLPVSVILTHFALLMPAFSLPCSPQNLAGSTSPHMERSPTDSEISFSNPQASVPCLAPSIFGATILDQ